MGEFRLASAEPVVRAFASVWIGARFGGVLTTTSGDCDTVAFGAGASIRNDSDKRFSSARASRSVSRSACMAVDNSMDRRVCFASRLAACFWRRAAMSCAVCAAPVAAASSAVSRSTSRAERAAAYRDSTRSSLAREASAASCLRSRTSSRSALSARAVAACAAEGGCGAGGVEMTSSGAAGGETLGARVDSTRSGVGVWREGAASSASMRRSRCMDAKLAACEASSAASRASRRRSSSGLESFSPSSSSVAARARRRRDASSASESCVAARTAFAAHRGGGSRSSSRLRRRAAPGGELRARALAGVSRRPTSARRSRSSRTFVATRLDASSTSAG